MEAVVAALDGQPEAVLVPTGGLGILPLHAASWRDHDGTRYYAADTVALATPRMRGSWRYAASGPGGCSPGPPCWWPIPARMQPWTGSLPP